MKAIKKFLKSVLGVYNIYVAREFYRKFFRTVLYKNECEFDEKSLKFYSDFINKGDMVYDIGANFGNRVRTFLKLEAKVIAVEPQESCCKYLRKKFGNRIILVDKAVGASNDIKKMYMSRNSMISSFSKDWIDTVKKERYSNEDWEDEKMIEQVTMDFIIEKYGVPDFIKIDVEGYEPEVLKGLTKVVKMISFEYTIPEQTGKAVDCIKRMKEVNGKIECNYSVGENMGLELKNWINEEEMINLISSSGFSNSIGDIYIRKVNI